MDVVGANQLGKERSQVGHWGKKLSEGLDRLEWRSLG